MHGKAVGPLDVGVRRTHIVVEPRRWAIPIYKFSCEACGNEFEQLVFRESASFEEDTQGLGVFISYTRRFSSGGFPIGRIWENLVGGMVYTGLIPSRNDDVLGAGVAWARLNQGGTNRETVVEWFYKARVTPWMSLQPDIQYIASPSGVYHDAFAVGLRFEVML